MFGKWSKRAEKRRRALEELLWLDPVDRERRIIAGVASGEFSADEAESALRLVSRLDSLRSMSLPRGGRLLGGKAIHTETQITANAPVPFAAAPPRLRETGEPGSGLPGEGGQQPAAAAAAASMSEGDAATTEDRPVPGEPVGIPVVPEPIGIPIGPNMISIPVLPDDEDDTTSDAAGRIVVPFDALDSAERWLAQGRTERQAVERAVAAGPDSPPTRTRTGRRTRKGLGPRVEWPADGLGEAAVPASSPDAGSTWVTSA